MKELKKILLCVREREIKVAFFRLRNVTIVAFTIYLIATCFGHTNTRVPLLSNSCYMPRPTRAPRLKMPF
jgi:hypothetical protein